MSLAPFPRLRAGTAPHGPHAVGPHCGRGWAGAKGSHPGTHSLLMSLWNLHMELCALLGVRKPGMAQPLSLTPCVWQRG